MKTLKDKVDYFCITFSLTTKWWNSTYCLRQATLGVCSRSLFRHYFAWGINSIPALCILSSQFMLTFLSHCQLNVAFKYNYKKNLQRNINVFLNTTYCVVWHLGLSGSRGLKKPGLSVCGGLKKTRTLRIQKISNFSIYICHRKEVNRNLQ